MHRKTTSALCLLLILVMLSVSAYAAPATVEPLERKEELATLTNLESEDFQSLCQGLDVYEEMEMEAPDYSGEVLSNNTINYQVLKTLDYGNSEQMANSVAQLKLNSLAQSSDFSSWNGADLSVGVPIYNYDETIYGYMYGIIKDAKVQGYIVAGACSIAPPIVEYSFDATKFLELSSAVKVYFGRGTGYVKANLTRSAISPNTVAENMPSKQDQELIDEQWQNFMNQATGVQPYSLVTDGKSHRLNINTPDYAWYKLCSFTAETMLFSVLGRNLDPYLLNTQNPTSIKLNEHLHNRYNHSPSFEKISNDIVNYANATKSSSEINFSKQHITDNNSLCFTTHKSILKSYEIPTMVGYAIQGGSAHIMLGIGYTDDDFYIVRDTWVYDAIPINSATFYYNKAAYTYHLISLEYTDTSSWGTSTLRRGDTGVNVQRLRFMLNALFYDVGDLRSSSFDLQLEMAVKAFQQDNGLTADGVVGSGTYKQLRNAHIMRYDNKTGIWRTLSQGKKGDDVAQLQFRLYELSIYSGEVDGIFGSSTKAAVASYQSKNGLTSDGVAGAATLAKLYSTYYKRIRYYERCLVCYPQE